MDYLNRIEIRYRYSHNKAASSIVSIQWMLEHEPKLPVVSNIRKVDGYNLADLNNELAHLIVQSRFSLSETRQIIRMIFANHREIMQEALNEGYKFMCIDTLFDHFAVTFIEDRYYDF